MRPGSVVGPQQQFLVDKEAVLLHSGARYRREAAAAPVALSTVGFGGLGEKVAGVGCASGAAAAIAAERVITAAMERIDEQIRDLQTRILDMQRSGAIPPIFLVDPCSPLESGRASLPTTGRAGVGRGDCPSA